MLMLQPQALAMSRRGAVAPLRARARVRVRVGPHPTGGAVLAPVAPTEVGRSARRWLRPRVAVSARRGPDRSNAHRLAALAQSQSARGRLPPASPLLRVLPVLILRPISVVGARPLSARRWPAHRSALWHQP